MSPVRLTRQQAFIAVSTLARNGAAILMGTGMAVYVGREGSEFAVSTVLAAYWLGMMLFAPFWGAVADVTGRRRQVLIVTGLAATAAVLPMAVVDGVWTPIGLRGLYAVFASGFPPVMLAVVSARGGDAGRGRSLGFYNSARAVGGTGGQLAAGTLLGLLAPSGLYGAIAAVSLVSTVVAAFVVDPSSTAPEPIRVDDVLAEVKRRLVPVEDRSHLRTNGLRWLYVSISLRYMTVFGALSLMPVYLVRDLGTTEFVMGALLAINPASQTICMYLLGRVADAAGRKPLIVAGMGGSALFPLLAAGASLVDPYWTRVGVAVLTFVVLAVSFSALVTGALAFIGDVAPPERQSELMGLRSTAQGVGGVLGPPLLGGIATLTSISTAFAVGSLLALVAAVVAATALVESRPADAAAPAVGDD